MESLNEPMLKLERAHEHLSELRLQSAKFMDSRPYAVLADRDAQEPLYRVRLKVVRPWPPRLSLLIGDFTQNLRAALDSLVWQLFLLNNPNLRRLPGTETPYNQIGFPILLTPSSTALRRRLRLVSPAAKLEIESLQPYQHGAKARGDWLWVLQTLSHQNVHGLIKPIGLRVKETSTPDGQISGWGEAVLPLEDGAPIGRLPNLLGEDARANLQIDASFETLIYRGGPNGAYIGIASLDSLYEYVRDTVFPRITGFF